MQRILNAENAFSSSLPSSFAKEKKRVSEIRKLPENINTLCTKLSFSKTEKFEKKNVALKHMKARVACSMCIPIAQNYPEIPFSSKPFSSCKKDTFWKRTIKIRALRVFDLDFEIRL